MDNGWLVFWVRSFMGLGFGLNSTSGVTRQVHHSQLMLPTTTPTTSLFLPDSRARMKERVQENKEKNKNRRVKSKAFRRHSSMMWAFLLLTGHVLRPDTSVF